MLLPQPYNLNNLSCHSAISWSTSSNHTSYERGYSELPNDTNYPIFLQFSNQFLYNKIIRFYGLFSYMVDFCPDKCGPYNREPVYLNHYKACGVVHVIDHTLFPLTSTRVRFRGVQKIRVHSINVHNLDYQNPEFQPNPS